MTSPEAERAAIRFEHVSKVYNLYGSRKEQVLDNIGLPKFLRGKSLPKHGEFHALRDVSFEIRRGERVGIIGRNGAGKTTMLRLITQNFAPTTGRVSIDGSVQALLQLGLGFHTEFTGHENIVASLNYNGLVGDAFEEALKEVIDFVELGDFLHQPVKAYSMGMQARLQFAAATAIRPDILIVDEVLGAGDAYFAAKSAHRMRRLATSGCTLLLVSHSTAEILRFCDRAIWMHQGSILMDGAALDVVRIYESYVEELNFKMRKQTEALWADVDAARLGAEKAVDSKPERRAAPADTGVPAGSAPAIPPPQVESANSLRVSAPEEAHQVAIRVAARTIAIPAAGQLDRLAELEGAPTEDWHKELFGELLFGPGASAAGHVERWPGEKGLKVRRLRLFDEHGKFTDRAQSGKPLTVEISVIAEQDGDFRFRASLLFMTLDGIGVTRTFSPYYEASLREGDEASFCFSWPEVMLTGNEFVFSCALFKHFDMVDGSTAIRYDLLARAFRLRVDGRLAHDPGLFHQPADWEEAVRITRLRDGAPT
jgi:lipopolysaccharide transport system ATP-binding protein